MSSKRLAFVFSKIQFATIPDAIFINEKATIQNALRKEYPVFLPNDEIQQVDFKIGPNGQQDIRHKKIPMIAMASADKNWGIRITPESIMLHTHQYTSFGEFQTRMKQLLETTNKALSISHTGFVGIRYINKIEHAAEPGFNPIIRRTEFLQPDLGSFAKAGSNLSSRYQTDSGWLNVNSGISVNSPKFSPEIFEMMADLLPENPALIGPWAHIDLDSFSENQLVDYNIERTMQKLEELRNHAKSAYLSIIKSS